MENAQPKKKMSRGKKAGIIVGAILALLIAAVLVYGFVLTRTGYWLIAKFTPNTPEQQLSYTSASDTVRQIAEEGFVLMQNNDDLLPPGQHGGEPRQNQPLRHPLHPDGLQRRRLRRVRRDQVHPSGGGPGGSEL